MTKNFCLWFALVKSLVLTISLVVFVGANQSAASEHVDSIRHAPVAEVAVCSGPERTTLVQEQAEQEQAVRSIGSVAQNVEGKLWPAFGNYAQSYEGLESFSGDDIILCFFENIGQLIWLRLCECVGLLAAEVQFFMAFLRVFVLLKMLRSAISGWAY